MYKEILTSTQHREDSLPAGPWLMTQRWDHLLFMHLPISKNIIKSQIPEGLELDTYNGQAWISIIPFQVNRMHIRSMPPFPFLKSYLELNVRTYVLRDGIKGIYFFSLDADKILPVLGARFVSLPYFHAKMKFKKKAGILYFESHRKGKTDAVFKGSYRPISSPYYPEKGSLSNWLLERYTLWSDKYGSLYRGDIHHKQWEIQDAEAVLGNVNMLPFPTDNTLSVSPILQYAISKRALFWPVRKIE